MAMVRFSLIWGRASCILYTCRGFDCYLVSQNIVTCFCFAYGLGLSIAIEVLSSGPSRPKLSVTKKMLLLQCVLLQPALFFIR